MSYTIKISHTHTHR